MTKYFLLSAVLHSVMLIAVLLSSFRQQGVFISSASEPLQWQFREKAQNSPATAAVTQKKIQPQDSATLQSLKKILAEETAAPVHGLPSNSLSLQIPYPALSRLNQEQGQVELVWDHRTQALRLNKSSGHARLDQAALRSVGQTLKAQLKKFNEDYFFFIDFVLR